MQRQILTILTVVAAALLGCAGDPASEPGAPAFDEAAFRAHVAKLASDEFEGRKPATPGEEKTVSYIRQQFEAAGLKPGNGSTFYQSVPLVEITADPNTTLTVSVDLGSAVISTSGTDWK